MTILAQANSAPELTRRIPNANSGAGLPLPAGEPAAVFGTLAEGTGVAAWTEPSGEELMERAGVGVAVGVGVAAPTEPSGVGVGVGVGVAAAQTPKSAVAL